MAAGSIFPAFVKAQFQDSPDGFPAFNANLDRTFSGAKRKAESAFGDIEKIIGRALDNPRLKSGALDLGVPQLRQDASMAEAKAAAYREVAAAAAAAAASEGSSGQAALIYARNAEVAAEKASQMAAAARLEADAIEVLQSQLVRTAGSTGAFGRALQGNARATGAQRTAMLQASQQVQDFAVQVAAGQSPMVAFSQQASQMAFVMANAGGAAGGLAKFLSGPWGTALFVATTALGLFATRSDESADAHKRHASAAEELAKAIEDLDSKTQSAIRTQQREIFVTAASAEQYLNKTLRIRQTIAAQIDEQRSKLRDAQQADALDTTGSRIPGVESGFAERELARLDAAQKRNEALIAKAQTSVVRARAAITQGAVKEALDPVTAANGRYERAVDLLNRKLETGKVTASAYRTEYERLTRQHDAAVEAAQKAERSNRGLNEEERAAAKAAREAAKEQRELDSALSGLESRFDPAAAAARRYAETVAQIARLHAAGRLTGADAERFGIAAGLERFEAETSAADRRRRELLGQLPEAFQKAGGEPLIDVGSVVDEFTRGMEEAADRFRARGLAAADAIADLLGSRIGDAVARAAAAKPDGPLAALGIGIQKGREDFDAEAAKQLNKVFGKIFGSGDFASQLGQALGQAAAGAEFGGRIGHALTDIFGVKGSKLGSQIGGAIGSAIGGPIGSIIGGTIGSAVGGAFKKTPTGSATIGVGANGELVVTGLSGSSRKLRQAANDNAGGAVTSIERIAEALGATVNASKGRVSIGFRNDNARVDTSGRGITKTKKGAIDFGSDVEAAVKFATLDLIKDGVIEGLRASTQRLLQQAKDLDAAIDKATRFESVFTRLRAIEDPVGAAVDAIDREFTGLKKIFAEAGASAEEYAKLEKLYGINRAEAIKQASEAMTASLKSLYDELTVGDNGRSLRDRLGAALANYDPLKARVAAGDRTAFDAFAEAARSVLDIQRQLSGSQGDYFARLDEITQLTGKALQDQQNIISIASAKPPLIGGTTPANDTAPVVSSIDRMSDRIAGVLSGELGSQLRAVNQNLGRLISSAGGGGGRPDTAFRLARLGF